MVTEPARILLGDVAVTRVQEYAGNGPATPAFLFPDSGAAYWADNAGWLDPDFYAQLVRAMHKLDITIVDDCSTDDSYAWAMKGARAFAIILLLLEKAQTRAIGRRMPLRDAAEAHVLGQKGGIGKILLLAPDSKE